MNPGLRKYIVSERFIHDGLVEDAKFLVKKVYDIWREKRNLSPSLLLWPARAIKADDGGLINNLITFNMPTELQEHKSLIRGAVDRVSAYAFFYLRREGSEIKALLETPHGTRSWIIPIVRSADVEVLKSATMREDKDYLSLLWTPKQGTS